MACQAVLFALADPTRRRLFERLLRRPHTVGELVRAQALSQPAISQHLKVLRDARLVTVRPEGTRRYYQATPEGLRGLRAWLDERRDDVLAGTG
jgi:DNA-binding transcriptional ArsR family regulator